MVSNCKAVHKLCLPWDPTIQTSVATFVATIAESSGKLSVTGSSDLKGTQAYPARFGKNVAEAYLNSIAEQNFGEGVGLHRLNDILPQCSGDPWDDACLEQVLTDLKNLQKDSPQP